MPATPTPGKRWTQRTRRMVGGVAVGICIAVALVALLYSTRMGLDRRVDGRSVLEWVRLLDGREPPRAGGIVERRRAASALARTLQPGATVDAEAARAASLALGSALGDRDTMVVATALDALRELTVLPDAASEEVVRLVTAGPAAMRGRAVGLLGHVAPGVRPAAAHALSIAAQDADTLVQADAMHILAGLLPQLGAADRRALLPLVAHAARAEATDMRASALAAYATFADGTSAEGRSAQLSADSVWGLVGDAMTSPSAEVRSAGAATLSDFAAVGVLHEGVAATSAVTALAGALDDPDAEVRGQAVRALGSFGQLARPLIPILRARLTDPSPGMQAAARAALARLSAVP